MFLFVFFLRMCLLSAPSLFPVFCGFLPGVLVSGLDVEAVPTMERG